MYSLSTLQVRQGMWKVCCHLSLVALHSDNIPLYFSMEGLFSFRNSYGSSSYLNSVFPIHGNLFGDQPQHLFSKSLIFHVGCIGDVMVFPLKNPYNDGSMSNPCNIPLIELSKISMDLPLKMIQSSGPSVAAKFFSPHLVVSVVAARFICIIAYDV